MTRIGRIITDLLVARSAKSRSVRVVHVRLWVLLLALLGLRCGPPRPQAEAMLADACLYLWAQQASDGGWHSATHGLLRGGQAWTPFVLHALLEAPDGACPRPPGGVERALAFLRRHINDEGALGLADPDVLEYPNYATAYALRVFARHSDAADGLLVEKMTAYLHGQQFVERRGFEAGDPAYGSWGFGEERLPPGVAGHVDLSHTRRVLEALREAGHADLDAYRSAEAFLRLTQKHPRDAGLDSLLFDGGFFASPVVQSVNKAGRAPGAPDGVPVFRSYATATADGLLALLAAGVPRDDHRVQAAVRWLRAHPALAYPEGIPQDDPDQWHRVLFFYHLAVRAEAYHALAWSGSWQEEMIRLLRRRQRADGSFSNPYGAPNKEDDPLLATSLVVTALGHATAASGAAQR